jgi:hypothetical protein
MAFRNTELWEDTINTNTRRQPLPGIFTTAFHNRRITVQAMEREDEFRDMVFYPYTKESCAGQHLSIIARGGDIADQRTSFVFLFRMYTINRRHLQLKHFQSSPFRCVATCFKVIRPLAFQSQPQAAPKQPMFSPRPSRLLSCPRAQHHMRPATMRSCSFRFPQADLHIP